MSDPIPITVKCLYCRREIDGYFYLEKKEEIKNLSSGKTIATVSEWNKKKGYLHVACINGIKAESELQEAS